jgi:hypothetical protein
MKLIKLFATSLLAMIFCIARSQPSELVLHNAMPRTRANEIVVISRVMLENKAGKKSENLLPVLKTERGVLVPTQVDDLNKDGKWDELVALFSFKPNEDKRISIQWIDRANYPAFPKCAQIRMARKVGEGKYTEDYSVTRLTTTDTRVSSDNFQLEGPVWENDCIGFRNYFDARNGIDIFGKRIPGLVLDTIWKDYHVLSAWGMDILKVGNSLGAGAIALMAGDSLYRIGPCEKGTVERIASGPLRSVFRLHYSKCQLTGQFVDITHEITMVAGKYGYSSKVTVNGLKTNALLITGIVNLHSKRLIFDDKNSKYVVMATYDEQSENNDKLGLALVINKFVFQKKGEASKSGEGITNTYYAALKLINNQPVEYSFYACWELAGIAFTTEEGFTDYLAGEVEKLTNPVKVH